ncbi:MAG TPA: hypothetical protein VEG34_12990, partial [Thermoanaerobaculia bacterium]|nr:hypothetical protein [Thermoanaerobaculia bacterium]
RIYVPRQDLDYAIGSGLRTLVQRHLVEERDGLYAARPGERALLAYYANSIAHLTIEGPVGGPSDRPADGPSDQPGELPSRRDVPSPG